MSRSASDAEPRLISSRRAAEILGAETGVGRRQARRLLDWEMAGRPVRTRWAVLHDEAKVRELAARPVLSRAGALDVCPNGLIVVRVGARPPGTTLDQTASDKAVGASLGATLGALPAEVSRLTALLVELNIAAHGPMPLVTTVAGWVAAGAEVSDTLVVPGTRPMRGHRALMPRSFEVQAPGAWYARLRGTQIPSGRGPAWLLWRPDSVPGQRTDTSPG